MARKKIKPEFTEAQVNEIRASLIGTIEFRVENDEDRRAANNALGELDRAQQEALGDC